MKVELDPGFTQGVVDFVQEKAKADALPIPSMRTAVMRCIAVLRQFDFSYGDVVSIIELDAGLAARVLWVSNSVVFGPSAKVRTLAQAVKRLGAQNLRTVLLDAAAHDLFVSEDPAVRDACSGFWLHSRVVGAASRDLAHLAMRDLDDTYLAGLLHDVGKPIVATLLLQSARDLLPPESAAWDHAEWLSAIDLVHRIAGDILLKKWGLSEAVASSIAGCTAYEGARPRSIANCVRLANALAKAEGFYVGFVDSDEQEDVIKQGQGLLGLPDEDLFRIRKGMKVRAKRDMQ